MNANQYYKGKISFAISVYKYDAIFNIQKTVQCMNQ